MTNMKTTTATARGHLPTLVASFMHFDLSFMLWVLFGAMGIHIAEDLNLTPAEKGLMVAVPILTGSLLRIPLGLMSDRIGGKRTGVVLLAFLFVPLALGWKTGDSLPQVLAIGGLLGTAGASFAVALPLASRWYPAERQGLVMGIAAAGNSGTVIANLLAPRLATIIGWHGVFGVAMLPLAMVLVAFLLMAKDSPSHGQNVATTHYKTTFKQRDLWWFCLFYSVTFGGYIGLSSFLPIFLRDQYRLNPVTAGYITAIAAFLGSGARPLGGYLADRFGGVGLLSVALLGIGVAYLLIGQSLSLPIVAAVVFVGMACLGMGNGSIFQLVPRRFPLEIGAASGLIGAVGGVGGFLLPYLLGNAREVSGSFAPGFFAMAVFAFVAFALLRIRAMVQEGWRLPWPSLRKAPADMGRVQMVPYL